MTSILFFDLETTSNPAALDLLPEPSAPSNYKDPAKIAAYCAEKKAALVEKAAVDWDLCRITTLSVAHYPGGAIQTHLVDALIDDTGDQAAADEGERQLVCRFWAEVMKASGNVAGSNILGFDLPVVLRRSLALGVKLPLQLRLQKYQTELVCDLMQIYCGWNTRELCRGLKDVCRLLGIPNPLPDLDGSNVAGMGKDTLYQHCRNDVQLSISRWEKMNGVFWLERFATHALPVQTEWVQQELVASA